MSAQSAASRCRNSESIMCITSAAMLTQTTMTALGRDFEAQRDDHGRRVDRVVRKMLPAAPLSLLYRLMRTGAVRVNGARTAPDARVAAGDRIRLPASLAPGPAGHKARAAPRSALPLPAVLDNEHLFVTSKPAGVSVAGPATERPLPLNHLLEPHLLEPHLLEPMLAGSGPQSLSFRPAAVHRLDRICSGLLIYAKTIDAARELTALLRERRAAKIYLALVERTAHRPRRLEARLRYDPARRRAVIDEDAGPLFADFRPIGAAAGLTLAAVATRTGRRHQVRALCAAAGMPLAGDRRYGSPRRRPPFLHAWLFCSTDPSLMRFAGAPWIEAPPEIERLARHSADWRRAADPLRARYLDDVAANPGPSPHVAAERRARHGADRPQRHRQELPGSAHRRPPQHGPHHR